jgi:citrate synthase
MPELIRAPNGLYGVIVSQSEIAKSAPDGSLIYRGYDIGELVRNASFEEVAFLISEGFLPNGREYERFRKSLSASMDVPPLVYEVLRRLPAYANSVDVLRTGLSVLASMDKGADATAARLSLASKMPALVANGFRLGSGLDVITPLDGLSYAENFMYMLTGERRSGIDVATFERALILYMEHDFNASAFTVRVVASTKADIYSAIIAGLSALKGPLHGGANQDVVTLLSDVGGPEMAEHVIKEKLAAGVKVAGFGHRIYKTVDPRAQIAKELLKNLVNERGLDSSLYETCNTIETVMWREKKLPANLDFYAAPIFYTLGIPVALYTSIFAMSRVFGWIAHYEEQSKEGKIIRPEAEYVGLRDLKYVPLDAR